jgi:hypothetical protein
MSFRCFGTESRNLAVLESIDFCVSSRLPPPSQRTLSRAGMSLAEGGEGRAAYLS